MSNENEERESSNKTIDLSGALEGTRPLTENSIPRLVPMITVEEPVSVDDAPDRLIFVVNGEERLRYVNLASLPSELVRVVNFLPGRPGLSFSKEHLVEAVKDLLVASERLAR